MSKVMLLSPRGRKFISDSKEFAPPIGLTWLASSLKEKGHLVKILDCTAEDIHNEELIKREDGTTLIRYGLSDENIRREITEFNPDLIGVSNNSTAQTGEVFDLCNLINDVSDAPLVVGGTHASMTAKEIMRKNRNINQIVIGEGEIPFLELVSKKIPLEEIAGLAYRKGDEIKINKKRPEPDINKLPLPSIELLNTKLYTRDTSIYYLYGVSQGDLWQAVSFSRGCNYACHICLSREMNGIGVRSLNLENIARMLEILRDYKITDISIEDNNFLQIPHSNEIADLLGEYGFRYYLINGVDPTELDEKIIERLQETGCHRVFYPVESANARSLSRIRKYGKKTKDEYRKIAATHKETVKQLTQAGIQVCTAYILGFPYESTEDMKNTCRLAEDIFSVNPRMVSTNVFCATPLPGSKLYRLCKHEGLLLQDRNNWLENSELYTFDHAQIGDMSRLKEVEIMRYETIYRANQKDMADFIAGGKSWRLMDGVD